MTHYYTANRPPMPGGIPKGAIDVQYIDKPFRYEGRMVYGIVAYERALDAMEARQYELIEKED